VQSITFEVIVFGRQQSWLGQSQIMGAVMRIWKMTHAALNFVTFRVIASRAAAGDLTAVINQRRPLWPMWDWCLDRRGLSSPTGQ